MMQDLRIKKDILFSRAMAILSVAPYVILFLIIFGLFKKSQPVLQAYGLKHLLTSSAWQPLKGNFGLLPFIAGTFWVTFISMILAVPLCTLTAIYLSEYATKTVRNLVAPLIDVLSGLPSVVYGIWGVLVIVPFIRDFIGPFFGVVISGYCVLAAGIILAIMVSPFIIHISWIALDSVPTELRQASLALGATKWQMIKGVVIRKAKAGIIASVVLGFSRAIGETMAVMMVVGNVAKIPKNVLEPAYPLTALIANNYGEMMSIPLYDSAILAASLVLLVAVLLFNVTARFILTKVERALV